MSFTATIAISDKNLQKLLAIEYTCLKKPRFIVEMKDDAVHIRASDIKALKGIMFSIIHAIETFEKVKKITENG